MSTVAQLGAFVREYARCGVCGGRLGELAGDNIFVVLPYYAPWPWPVFPWSGARPSAMGVVCHDCRELRHVRWEINEALELLLSDLPDELPSGIVYHDICDLEDL